MNESSLIYVAGHRGLAGAAIVRRLRSLRFENLVTRGSQELDLRDQLATERFVAEVRPEVVIMAAARVGGIHANNTRPADFIRDNLQIQTNLIDSSYRNGVRKLVFLGSSCIYPRLAPQPMRESCLLTGELEPTNEWYAIAKISGLKMCQAYRRQYGFDTISLMPTNLYGPGDNFSEMNSHVLPALIRRFHEARVAGAKSVTIWGSGTPRREFLHVDDFADAVVMLTQRYSEESPINIGTGEDVAILELARLVAVATGFSGDIELDRSKPDGTPRKLLDVSRLAALGWRARIGLADGIRGTAEWYAGHLSEARK
ncbi:MAG: GDP-L-fucose synthase [Gammaproteobacteria bacterium]